MQNLAKQRIVVLGGSSGIGLEVARQAAAEGAQVVIASSNAKRLDDAIAAVGGQTEGRELDVSDEPAVRAFFEGLGPFDHLVFTAGDTLQLIELDSAELTKARGAFEVRYWGALAAVKYAHAKIRPGGSIVLTSGIASRRPRKGWTLGASVCGAMDALTRALAVELAPIRVNAVSPGVIRTNLWQNIPGEQRDAMFQSIGSQLPVGRVGEAPEIAAAYLFLMREGFSTGQVMVVDGGSVLV